MMKDGQTEPGAQAETEVSIPGAGVGDGSRGDARGDERNLSSEGASGSLGSEMTIMGVRAHADHCAVGIAVTAGESCTVSYANSTFRQAAGASDRTVLGMPLFEAFPLLNRTNVQAAVSAALRQRDETGNLVRLADVAGDDVARDVADERLRDMTLVVAPVLPDHDNAVGDFREEPHGLLIQLRDAASSADSRDQSRSDGGYGPGKPDRRRVPPMELLEVNQRLVVAALREHELKERAEEASRAKSVFLATMSHELRTPLNAIIGYASLLDDGMWGPIVDEQHRHIQRLKTSAQHLLALINDVLTLARVEADKERVFLETVEASSLVDEVLALTMPLAVTKNLQLAVSMSETFTLQTDRGKLIQILVNLVSNAIKFTNNGDITLGAAVRDGEAEFCVQDTGIGITSSDLQRVFDMFWQVDHDLTRTAGGTGLGLNVSRQLVALLGGRIAVESEPGVGSTFTVRLPMGALTGRNGAQ